VIPAGSWPTLPELIRCAMLALIDRAPLRLASPLLIR
jgi:hypothetical protein